MAWSRDSRGLLDMGYGLEACDVFCSDMVNKAAPPALTAPTMDAAFDPSAALSYVSLLCVRSGTVVFRAHVCGPLVSDRVLLIEEERDYEAVLTRLHWHFCCAHACRSLDQTLFVRI